MVTPKKDDKVRITGLSSGHAFPVGTIVTVMSANSTNRSFVGRGDNRMQYTIYYEDAEPMAITKENIEKEIKSLKEQVRVLEVKLAYMKKKNKSEYNETEYKVYATLQTLGDKKLTEDGKVEIITKLLS